MSGLYRHPLRVYLVLGCLALWGIISGLQLPVSLFPNSSRPRIQVRVPYGDMNADEFLKSYGSLLEGQLKAIIVGSSTVDELEARYDQSSVNYYVQFTWGTPGKEAKQEVAGLMASAAAGFPDEVRRSYSVDLWRENTGFLAVSIFSPKLSINELYDQLNPLFAPMTSAVPDAESAGLSNPNYRYLRITLNPERMALLNLLPVDIERAILNSNTGFRAGSLKVGTNSLGIEIPRETLDHQQFGNITLLNRKGQALRIKDVAEVAFLPNPKQNQISKTMGEESLILWANPKAEGNIKKMSDDAVKFLESVKPQFPEGVGYKILVNPSDFINSAIRNVFHEVGLAALLAVIILFVFIGSPRNVMTAAIEIPMSIVLAFILMKFFGMNLNLISLGGLALSAGMNVDASVVVMENIFRHFEKVKRSLDWEEKVALVAKAVNEVKGPVIAATIASLVVFIPLIATQGLSNAILGDLAKAVVFSHGLSAVVALILVPTIRLQLMRSEGQVHPKSLIHKQFVQLENFYARLLEKLILRKRAKLFAFSGTALVLILLVALVIPKLPKEIIGKPDTDWLVMSLSPTGSTSDISLITELLGQNEQEGLKLLGDDVLYTFSQARGESGEVLFRLRDRRLMDKAWKQLEARFETTPTLRYWIGPFNPSELRIPDPPDMQISIQGGDPTRRLLAAESLRQSMMEEKIFPNMWINPWGNSKDQILIIQPNRDALTNLLKAGASIGIADLSNFMRVATEGKTVGYWNSGTQSYAIQMEFPDQRVNSLSSLAALPLPAGDKIIPLSALAQLSQEPKKPSIRRLNQAEVQHVIGREKRETKQDAEKNLARAETFLEGWKKDPANKAALKDLNIGFEDANKEFNQELNQLKIALLISLLLIFMVMVIQFGDIAHALLVMLAIPLGVIGVLLSLWVFRSTLSLNSVLGVILLNGIAVANSVILVDLVKRLVEEGQAPLHAALAAARARLRPILMTSLTTVLGMFPLALGLGEGGKILQPLGIAVAGGLWVSTLLTLFLVPTLHVAYLNRWSRVGRPHQDAKLNKIPFRASELDL